MPTGRNICREIRASCDPDGSNFGVPPGFRAGEVSCENACEAAQVLGGASFLTGSKVERVYREVRVNAIGRGSEEIMLDLAGRQLFA